MGFERLTAYLDSLEARYGVPGADLKITRGHDLVYRHMVGHRDYEKQIPVSSEDMYDIYSGSKPISGRCRQSTTSTRSASICRA